jgi:hypothetical protein
MPGMEIAVPTELSSGAISSILEAVPGIATVLRSPVADAIVNLSRAAAGLAPFDKKDAHELIRYAVRRGLIRSDEGDRVMAEIDGVAVAPRPAAAPTKSAPHRPPPRKPARAKPHRRPKPPSRPKPAAKRAAKAVKKK